MKILVCGHGRHGKDEFAEQLGLPHSSSSWFACNDFIFDALKNKYGYETVEQCYNDRHNHRKEWFQMIEDYNKDDWSKLSKNILKEYDVYVGMRSLKEFEASKHLYDDIVWIDASERVPLEDDSSNKITKEMCKTVITNNGTLEEFYEKIREYGDYRK